MNRKCLTFVVVLLLCVTEVLAQSKICLYGKVVDEYETPVEFASIIVEKQGLNVACGAIGIGEITSIPTAPAIADAYCRYDGRLRTSLPLEGTPYSRK